MDVFRGRLKTVPGRIYWLAYAVGWCAGILDLTGILHVPSLIPLVCTGIALVLGMVLVGVLPLMDWFHLEDRNSVPVRRRIYEVVLALAVILFPVWALRASHFWPSTIINILTYASLIFIFLALVVIAFGEHFENPKPPAQHEPT